MIFTFFLHIIGGINIIGGSNVTAKRDLILEVFSNLSEENGLPFSVSSNLKSPDSTTLFTTSGMQQFKALYGDTNFKGSFSNIQKCLRLNDLSEVGDGTHRLTFEMLGLFSFREWSLKQGIDFMIKFLSRINLKPDYITVHPDKIDSWSPLYFEYGIPVRTDKECIWSDGNIGGFCTEFYINDIEIGNIVNPLGDCLDIGFGLERLLLVSNSLPEISRLELLEETCVDLINSGVTLGNNQSEYILKKLILICIGEDSSIDHPFFKKLRYSQIKNYKDYLKSKTKNKNKDKPSSYWLETYGIDELKIDFYERQLKNNR